mmetsp:Transcript_56564/g.132695  ORF Transcript_56564/g.132695 Transcript_56564/m.132695 type:complete len:508 (+) Transcript_56564:76-1599(+)
MPEAPLLVGEDSPQIDVPGVAILMVCVTMFIDTLAGSISTPVMPYYAKAFDVSTANIGWLYGLWSFSSTVFAPWLTRLADRIGRRPVLIMSLVGAGTANIIQGVALMAGKNLGFKIFLFGRFFSGIWAAVGATCNVYITDVVPEEIRAPYIARISTVPLIAMLFGPGLGGGLAKLGLNIPVMIDGAITLFSAGLVSYYLPETPSYIRSKMCSEAHAGEGGSKSSGSGKATTPVPSVVYILGFGQFLGGIGFSTMLSSYAVFMLARFDFDTLRVGFSFMAGSIVMMMVNVWGVPFCKKHFSIAKSIVLGGLINSFGFFMFAHNDELWLCLFFFIMSMGGNALRGANSTAYLGSFSDSSNRGAVFGVSQMMMNAGRVVGPIVATHLADWYGVGVPFYLAGSMSGFSALLVLWVDSVASLPPKELSEPMLKKQATSFGSDWKDEHGTHKEVEDLGNFVADLLSKRHYQWVSKKAEVEALLDKLLPELQTTDRDSYHHSIQDLEPQGKHYT